MQFAVSPAYFSVKYSKQQKIGKAVLVFPIFHSIGSMQAQAFSSSTRAIIPNLLKGIFKEEWMAQKHTVKKLVFQKLNIDVDDLTIKELIQLISEYPNLLRRPIILDNKRMQIGFNEDEIRAFLPRDYRKQELRQATIRAEIEGNND